MAAQDPFRFLGKVYDNLIESTERHVRTICLEVRPPNPNQRVLDVGCGTGTHLAIYQRAGCQVAGVDPSPTMLSIAQRKLGMGADLRPEGATQMSFPDGAFDLVVMMFVLHEMPPTVRQPALQECKRVLAARGTLLLADYQPGPYPFPNGWGWKAPILAFEIIAGREHFMNYRDFMSHRGLIPLIEAQQLCVEERRIPPSRTVAVYALTK